MMDAALYMDAEIKPNRSLSERGFIILISVITLANVASAAVFVRLGAHWVLPFLGIDLLAIIVAFIASFRSGRIIERIQVSPGERGEFAKALEEAIWKARRHRD